MERQDSAMEAKADTRLCCWFGGRPMTTGESTQRSVLQRFFKLCFVSFC